MKKWTFRILILAFILSMLQLPALASLQDHNVSDITIVQSTDESNYYFPDALTLPDGTLLVVYYKSASHKSDVGTIWGVKSNDNGQSWGEPFAVVDRSAEALQARDPNLALLPDGTIILTYFTNATTGAPERPIC